MKCRTFLVADDQRGYAPYSPAESVQKTGCEQVCHLFLSDFMGVEQLP